MLAIVNIALMGILCSFICYYMDSLWCAMALHTAWNYTQNIILGLPNSGVVSILSIFKLDASTALDSFAYNVGFGVEGTVVSAIVQIAAIALIYYKYKDKKPSLFTRPQLDC